jgi:hypothetical protein
VEKQSAKKRLKEANLKYQAAVEEVRKLEAEGLCEPHGVPDGTAVSVE